jgi:outer membrane murein-binding lipoprotein Lpp
MNRLGKTFASALVLAAAVLAGCVFRGIVSTDFTAS